MLMQKMHAKPSRFALNLVYYSGQTSIIHWFCVEILTITPLRILTKASVWVSLEEGKTLRKQTIKHRLKRALFGPVAVAWSFFAAGFAKRLSLQRVRKSVDVPSIGKSFTTMKHQRSITIIPRVTELHFVLRNVKQSFVALSLENSTIVITNAEANTQRLVQLY
uniref:Uncharacterized protein n=1 Tax=Glossina austeni TaxID=7395 RepID=A0A1A9V5D1_GLOAU